jgi:hypothetical protein
LEGGIPDMQCKQNCQRDEDENDKFGAVTQASNAPFCFRKVTSMLVPMASGSALLFLRRGKFAI